MKFSGTTKFRGEPIFLCSGIVQKNRVFVVSKLEKCMEEKLYYYRAKIISVYDGDTCRADIDLGMGIWVRNEKLRLLRINAPEMRGPEKVAGKVSRDFLRELVLGKEVFIQTKKDRRGKYGRFLAEIWLEEEADHWINVNDRLVEAGQAVYKEY